MRAQFKAVAALCEGRSRLAVLGEFAIIAAVVPILWFAACVFALLEPLP